MQNHQVAVEKRTYKFQPNFNNMKLDSKGNILAGSLAILIITLFLVFIFVFTSINYIENENIEFNGNDNFKYIVDDYANDLEILQRDSIERATEKVYTNFRLLDSEHQIKKNLNEELSEKNEEYLKKYGVKISSQAVSVKSSSSPWKVSFKVKISMEKDNIKFNKIIERNTSIEGLKDPLPPAILTSGSGISYYKDKIYYLHSLSRYMWIHHLDSPESYMFATAPLTIKKCPYDPYIHHGDYGVLEDCLDKGYFHESADGSCYLCRLEGKGKCEHYGLEVFIQTHTPLNNTTLSCSDHVVYHDHYNGEKISSGLDSLILDSSHKKKYGLIKDGQQGNNDN